MEELELKSFLELIKRKKLLIIIFVIIGAFAGFIFNYYLTTPKYKSTVTFLLTQSADEDANSITTSDLTLNSDLIENYSELIKSSSILTKTLNQLNITMTSSELANLKKNITVETKSNTEVLEMSVSTEQKNLAPLIANKLVEVFKDEVKEIYKIENVYIVDPATEATSPYNINPKKYTILGACIGLLFSLIIIFFINFFDDSLKSDKDIERIFGLRTLATFRKQSNIKNLSWNPKDDYVEGFKALRTNLQFVNRQKDIKTISITSTLNCEGKSWISSNLGLAFAKADYNVLIVDADLRKGTQCKIFETGQFPGLSNLILDNIDPCNFEIIEARYIHSTKIDNVSIIPSGNLTFDSSELLLSNKLHKLIDTLESHFDIIIFDSTPSALITDATIISRLVDTTIIVTEFEKTTMNNLRNAKNQIEEVGGKVAGIVINKVLAKKDNYYYYGNSTKLQKNKKNTKVKNVSKQQSYNLKKKYKH